MPNLRALPVVLLLSCASCASSPPLRVLSSEPPALTPELEAEDVAPKPAPRIGAPGGSGAGSRSVIPAQSGNETVGGLPAGIGGGSGPRG